MKIVVVVDVVVGRIGVVGGRCTGPPLNPYSPFNWRQLFESGTSDTKGPLRVAAAAPPGRLAEVLARRVLKPLCPDCRDHHGLPGCNSHCY
jgi:hypothetical protein